MFNLLRRFINNNIRNLIKKRQLIEILLKHQIKTKIIEKKKNLIVNKLIFYRI